MMNTHASLLNRVLTENTPQQGFRIAAPDRSAALNSLLWQTLSWHQASLNQVNQLDSYFQHAHPFLETYKTPFDIFGNTPFMPIHVPMIPSIKIEEESVEFRRNQENIFECMQRKALALAQKGVSSSVQRQWLLKYRASKIEIYLTKKRNRNYKKKILYDTRKRVADRRIRFKGKFINEIQAQQILGLANKDVPFEELRRLMLDLQASSR